MALLAFASSFAAQPEPPSPPPPAGAFRVEERNEDLRFAYGWGAEVQEFPALVSLLEGRRDAARLREFDAARTSRAEQAGDGGAPPAHDFEQDWRALGRAGPLLSLVALVSFYRGGAHGSARFEGLLWDQTSGRPISVGDLLTGDWTARFAPRYCEALNRERLEKLGSDSAAPPDMRTDCPELADHVVLPEDTNGNGRFDTLRVFLPPYAAGAYVEGIYEPAVRFTRADIDAAREDVRAQFEALR